MGVVWCGMASQSAKGWKSGQQQEHLSSFRHWQNQCIPMQIINARPQRWGWIVYRCMQKQKVKTKQTKSFCFLKSLKKGKTDPKTTSASVNTHLNIRTCPNFLGNNISLICIKKALHPCTQLHHPSHSPAPHLYTHQCKTTSQQIYLLHFHLTYWEPS